MLMPRVAQGARPHTGDRAACRAQSGRLALAALCLAACGGSASEAQPPPPLASAQAPSSEQLGPIRSFAFPTLDGTVVSSGSLRGRLTVIGLVASYDAPSQSQALFLRALARDHAPRINVLLVMLETEEARPMIDAFEHALAAPFPVVLGDADAMAGRAPFPGLREVPSLIVLDADGHELWRHVGQLDQQQLDDLLRDLESRRPGSGPR
jgi:hypothetical protein